MDFRQNRDTLLKKIDVESFMVVNIEGSDPNCMYYLSGYTGEGILMVSTEQSFLLVDKRYTEAAERETPDLCRVTIEKEYAPETVAFIRRNLSGRIAFSSKRISYFFVETIITASGATSVPLEDPVADLRMVKTPFEIEKIKRSIQVAESALFTVMQDVRAGMTETEIAWAIESEMRELGATGPAFPIIVATGENSALPHHCPGERKLKAGDLLLCDLGARVDGYCSDMTRVFSAGPIGEKEKKRYAAVLRAQETAIAAIKPGITGSAVDAAAFSEIISSGYEAWIAHRLGHGVGLEVHEGPRLSPVRGETKLEMGMILALEPAIYKAGFGGIRIEDMVEVTENGCQLLTSFHREEIIEVG